MRPFLCTCGIAYAPAPSRKSSQSSSYRPLQCPWAKLACLVGLASWLTGWTAGGLASRLVWPAGCMVGWPAGPASWLAGWLAGQWVGWLVSWLAPMAQTENKKTLNATICTHIVFELHGFCMIDELHDFLGLLFGDTVFHSARQVKFRSLVRDVTD